MAVLLFSGTGFSESELTKQFIDALDQKDSAKLASIVKDNKDKIPGEIKAIIAEAALPETTKDDRESKFYLAEIMARTYKDSTGDIEPLKDVKRKNFESRLTQPVRSAPTNGVHTVEFPKATETAKNIFKPDNIIIKKGESVRWVNNDETGHVFSSMPLIGLAGIFTPRIEPGQTWEYKFEKTGDYYYICFIHHGMIGKITVEE